MEPPSSVVAESKPQPDARTPQSASPPDSEARYQRRSAFLNHPRTKWGLILVGLVILVGIFFLSFCYHQLLWIYIGLSGALYSAVKRHAPDWEVRFGLADLALVIATDVALVAILFVYTRLKAP